MGLSTAPSAYTAASLRTDTPNAVYLAYNEKLRRSGQITTNPFRALTALDNGGKEINGMSGAPISIISDLSTMGGEKVRFTKFRGTNQKAKLGEQTLMGTEAKIKFGTYDVVVDHVRVGTAYTRKQLLLLAKGNQLVQTVIENTDRDLGLKQRDFILQRLVERTTAGRNLLFPNTSRSTVDTMTSADTISTDAIARIGRQMTTIGAAPINNKKLRNGACIAQYLFFGPEDVLAPLYSDTSYNNAAQYALQRGEDNVFFAGGFVPWRGQQIWHWNVIDEDTSGPIGTYLNPKAALGVAISAGTAVIALKGGGAGYSAGDSPAIDYFRYFPGGSSIGAQYESETRASDTGIYYIKIVHPTSGKWGFYRYTGNDNIGTGITTHATAGRLAASASVSAATTVGSVTWDAAKNTEDLPVGSMMYWANASGQILGRIGALGSDAVLLANGGGAMGMNSSIAYSPKSIKGVTELISGSGSVGSEGDDYGMVQSVAAEAIFGVDVPLNTLGQYQNHAIVPVVYTPAAGGGL